MHEQINNKDIWLSKLKFIISIGHSIAFSFIQVQSKLGWMKIRPKRSRKRGSKGGPPEKYSNRKNHNRKLIEEIRNHQRSAEGFEHFHWTILWIGHCLSSQSCILHQPDLDQQCG